MADKAQSQYAAPPEAGAPETETPKVEAVTTIHPMLTVSERYDSNIYFIPGRNLQDYVTTVSPQVKVDHNGRLVGFALQGGISANYYVRNPGLNYIGANGSVYLNMNQALSSVVRGASLQVSDAFGYTPQPPAFLAPTTGNVVDTGFVQGVQAGRANSFSNMGQANAGYQLSPTIALQASYVNGIMRFGQRFTPAGQSSPFSSGNFFTTKYQIVTAGPNFQVSPRDSINVDYQYQQMAFGFGLGSTFVLQGGIVGWKRKLTPTLTASATGGFTVITPGNTLQYTGSALVQWQGEKTSAKLQYQRSIKPSFFLIGVPLVTQSYSLNVSRVITEQLTVSGSANYSQSTAAEVSVPLSFRSYSVSVGADYQMTQYVVATVSYNYNNFVYNSFGSETMFNRTFVMLSIRAEW